MKNWYTMQAKAGADAADISIFDEIGYWGITAKDFINDLRALGSVGTINLSINSPGGSVFDGLAIYNALRGHKATVNVKVMGIAASAASFIAMAGDKISMPANTFMMVHNPWGGAVGNADDMREIADILDKIGASLIGIYVARTGKSEAEVKALLDAETYMTAAEALALGFADEVVDDLKIAASFDLDRVPEAIRAAFKTSTLPDDIDSDDLDPDDPDAATAASFTSVVIALAKAAGYERFALNLATSCLTTDEVSAKLIELREISDLCALASTDADSFITAGKSLAEVRAAIIDERASGDEGIRISNARRQPNSPAPLQPSAAVKTADIWAKRRAQSTN